MTRPTLLIVSYHFAPSPLVGAKRFSFLTREFTRMGFEVHVIANEIGDSAYGREDHSLPAHGPVHRVANPLELPRKGKGLGARIVNALSRRLLAAVGMDFFWAGAATRKALEVVSKLPLESRHGLVIATSPPHAAMMAGGRIARRLGWPLILDYRDPWSAYDWPAWHRGALTQWLATHIERRLVRQSAARVLNTPSMLEWYLREFPFANDAESVAIPNGFDAVEKLSAPDAAGALRILHAGEIYGSRSLVPLLQAIKQVSARHPERAIRLTNYGPLPAHEKLKIRAAGLEEFAEERPRVPFQELRVELQRAHLLLAVVSEHMTYSTPYKVYDYMASGRPILGLAPRDAALHDLLEESGAGECAEPQDIAGIEAAIERALFSAASADAARVDRFHWDRLAQQYRAVIEAAASRERTAADGEGSGATQLAAAEARRE
jgi:glycosyltransferase involved in cell wall biosynthesis